MSDSRYLIVHKDHPMDALGINSGAEMATLSLARYLAKTGHKVVVAAELRSGSGEVHEGVEFWDLTSQYRYEDAIERMSLEGPYHLISAGRSQPLFESNRDPNCLSRILISHDRSGNDTGIAPRVLCERIDRVVCVSEAQRRVFLEAGANPSKVTTIHNGVDLELFSAGSVEQRDWRRLVFVGALVPDKGIDLLLNAYVQLLQKYPDLKLDVYGSADLWGRKEMLQTEEISRQLPNLTFHGKVSQTIISEAFRSAGVCVVPSIWFDPFPLTALEAQVSGCPVVTFDVGGLPEGLRHGETGLVVDDVSEEGLIRGLDALLSDTDRLQQMSRDCLKSQRAYFDWTRVAQEIADLSESIARERRLERVGVVTTWQQECGLATYAKFLFSKLPQENLTIFAEREKKRTEEADGSNVIRCWSWESKDWGELEKAVSENGCSLLHFNLHSPPQAAALVPTLNSLRAKGVKTAAHFHSIFTVRPQAVEALNAFDSIIVHSPEMRLEVIAQGVEADRVHVLPHGIEQREPAAEEEKQQRKEALGLSLSMPVAVSFGFVQPHKGLEDLIETTAALKGIGIEIQSVIAGTINPSDEGAEEYRTYLRGLIDQFEIADRVLFLDRFLTEEEVEAYLRAADVIVMNYRSQHYEASGACSLALGMGAPVITSTAPCFQAFGEAVWRVTTGFPLSLSLSLLTSSQEFRASLQSKAQDFAKRNSWPATARKLEMIYQQVLQHQLPTKEEKKVKAKTSYRILIQNRKNMFSQPGGDTIVVQKLVKELEQRGVSVTIDAELQEDPGQYDLVHLINFALPQMLRPLAERARQAGVPYVVTTLCEDVPSFHHQSHAVAEALIQYVEKGQDRDWINANFPDIEQISGCPPFENSWAAKNAAALLVNGSREGEVIRKTYGETAPIHVVPVGHELSTEAGPELFEREYGLKDFVLCVGRIESRKNQLMLLRALEEIDIPLVFVAGGFSYQPDYDRAARTFQRKGKTLFLDRLSDEMLSSAYAAAKVHALPSWYELPGLVSLEAARANCNVVATRSGTAPDYFGDLAFYCEPHDAESIRNAVIAAYYSPVREGIAQHVSQFTWAAAAEKALDVYEQLLGSSKSIEADTTPTVESAAAPQPEAQEYSYDREAFERISEEGFQAAADKDLVRAHELLQEAEAMNPRDVRVLRNRAAVHLAEENHAEARRYFERVLAIEPNDTKALSGLGMCLVNIGQREEAYDHFVRALSQEPLEMVAILQLLECSYSLERYNDVERIIRQFLGGAPDHFDMRYCLAGVLWRQKKIGEAREVVDALLKENPSHQGALELWDALEKSKATLREQIVSEAVQDLAAREAPEPKAFDSLDHRLNELEELKIRREYSELLAGAEELLERGSLSEAQHRHAAILKAEALGMTGKPEDAKLLFEEVLQADPENVRAICGSGAITASESRFDEAKALFEKARQLSPEYDKAFSGLAFCACQDGDFEKGWEWYKAALEKNPENISALLGLLQLGYQLGRVSAVEQALERYLEMHPADLNFLYSYAGCLFAQERFEEARSEVEKILLFDPSNANALELRDEIAKRVSGETTISAS